LEALSKQGLVSFKVGITLQELVTQAMQKTDLQAAQEMQKAKADLFDSFNKQKRKLQA